MKLHLSIAGLSPAMPPAPRRERPSSPSVAKSARPKGASVAEDRRSELARIRAEIAAR